MYRRILPLLILLALIAALGAWFTLRLSLPQPFQRLVLPGLGEPVTLRHDQWRRPFVRAATLADALQVQGWLHARHRLWQMELLRRAGQGRMAELFGVDLLATDKALWRVGVPQLAAGLEENAGPEILALIDQYLAGVNGAIAGHTVWPPEFLLLGAQRPRWQRRDVFALAALMAFQSANNMQNELLRLALSRQLDEQRFSVFLTDDSDRGAYPFVIPQRDDGDDPGDLRDVLDRIALTHPDSNPLMPRFGFGSNGWVVSAARSSTGAPLYAFDSHDALGLPNLFYEVHLFFGEGRQLRGWSVAGLPGVINGYNENIAWGFTNIGDTQDLFLETRSGEDPVLFRDGDEWYRARSETVSIAVKGREPERLTIVHTRNGPLVSEDPPISLAWTVHRIDSPRLDSLLDLNLARNWKAFNAALDAFPAPTLNATYADVHGTIGFRTGGAIPRRGRGHGLLPLDGSIPGNRWQGLVPPQQMPRVVNPAEGFLAAANSRVQVPAAGPLVSADNAAPYRMARIRQVLSAGGNISPLDMQRLQTDRTDGQAQMLLPALLRELDRARLNDAAAVALPLLETWAAAPVASPDSAAALLFQQWYVDIAREVFAEATGELYENLLKRAYLLNHALDHLILHGEHSSWWRDDRPGLLTSAFNRAVEQLTANPGGRPDTWRLDQRLHVQLRHELGKAVPVLSPLFDQADAPWGGGPSTVGRARYSYAQPFAVRTAATVRVVADMQPAPRVAAVVPGGQSGHPLSRHYADQYRGWLEGELYPIAAAAGELPAQEMLLVPAQ